MPHSPMSQGPGEFMEVSYLDIRRRHVFGKGETTAVEPAGVDTGRLSAEHIFQRIVTDVERLASAAAEGSKCLFAQLRFRFRHCIFTGDDESFEVVAQPEPLHLGTAYQRFAIDDEAQGVTCPDRSQGRMNVREEPYPFQKAFLEVGSHRLGKSSVIDTAHFENSMPVLWLG